MTRCIHFPFIVLLVVWRNQSILGSDVDLVVRDATCVGNNVTLKCTINPFTTVPSATWSRNGSNALTTCTSGGPCTQDDLTIDGVKYSFSGGSTGIQVAFQIQLVENGIEWICSHNATPYRYTFEVNTCTTSTVTTTTNSSALTSTTTLSIQLQNSTECCFIKYTIHFDKGVCIIFYVLLVLVCVVILILVVYLCKRQIQNKNTPTGDSDYDMSDSKKRKTAPTSKTNPNSSSYYHEHRKDGNKKKTGRYREKASSSSKSNTFQEGFSTNI